MEQESQSIFIIPNKKSVDVFIYFMIIGAFVEAIYRSYLFIQSYNSLESLAVISFNIFIIISWMIVGGFLIGFVAMIIYRLWPAMLGKE